MEDAVKSEASETSTSDERAGPQVDKPRQQRTPMKSASGAIGDGRQKNKSSVRHGKMSISKESDAAWTIGGVAQEAAERDAEADEAQTPWPPLSSIPLDRMLQSLYSRLQPSEPDHQCRLDVIERVNNVISRIQSCQGARIVPFGSFESNFYTPWGDLDLSLELPPVSTNYGRGKAQKGRILRDVFHSLKRAGMALNLELIAGARVPLVMFRDRLTGIACDISLDNDGGCVKSRVLRWISEMDERCRQLIFLVKCWAKAQNINDPKAGTLNSYAISHLVLFHLQTRSPPVLPPLEEILPSGNQTAEALSIREKRNLFFDGCRQNITRLKEEGYSSHNRSSLAQLFSSFFLQYAGVSHLWQRGLAARTFCAQWGDLTSTCRDWARKDYDFTVEDPFDRLQNCARSVQHATVEVVWNTFRDAARALSSPPPETALNNLRRTLFLWPEELPRPGIRAWPGGALVPPASWRKPEQAREPIPRSQRQSLPRSHSQSQPRSGPLPQSHSQSVPQFSASAQSHSQSQSKSKSPVQSQPQFLSPLEGQQQQQQQQQQQKQQKQMHRNGHAIPMPNANQQLPSGQQPGPAVDTLPLGHQTWPPLGSPGEGVSGGGHLSRVLGVGQGRGPMQFTHSQKHKPAVEEQGGDPEVPPGNLHASSAPGRMEQLFGEKGESAVVVERDAAELASEEVNVGSLEPSDLVGALSDLKLTEWGRPGSRNGSGTGTGNRPSVPKQAVEQHPARERVGPKIGPIRQKRQPRSVGDAHADAEPALQQKGFLVTGAQQSGNPKLNPNYDPNLNPKSKTPILNPSPNSIPSTNPGLQPCLNYSRKSNPDLNPIAPGGLGGLQTSHSPGDPLKLASEVGSHSPPPLGAALLQLLQGNSAESKQTMAATCHHPLTEEPTSQQSAGKAPPSPSEIMGLRQRPQSPPFPHPYLPPMQPYHMSRPPPYSPFPGMLDPRHQLPPFFNLPHPPIHGFSGSGSPNQHLALPSHEAPRPGGQIPATHAQLTAGSSYSMNLNLPGTTSSFSGTLLSFSGTPASISGLGLVGEQATRAAQSVVGSALDGMVPLPLDVLLPRVSMRADQGGTHSGVDESRVWESQDKIGFSRHSGNGQRLGEKSVESQGDQNTQEDSTLGGAQRLASGGPVADILATQEGGRFRDQGLAVSNDELDALDGLDEGGAKKKYKRRMRPRQRKPIGISSQRGLGVGSSGPA